MFGVYPTYKEASFIREKIKGRHSGQLKIESTTAKPTTMNVAKYLKRMEERRN